MAERFARLFSCPVNQYAEGSPVIIAAGALLRDNETGSILAQLKFKNIQENSIALAVAEVTPLDTVGRPIGEPVQQKYLDLNAGRDSEFGSQMPIFLPADARSFTAKVVEIGFADNTVVSDFGAWEPLPGAEKIETALGDEELTKQYRLEIGKDADYRAAKVRNLWYCTCGEINRDAEDKCARCGRNFADIAAIDIPALTERKEKRLAEEKAEAERKAAEEAEKKRIAEQEAEENRVKAAKAAAKKRKLAVIAGIAAVVCIAVFLLVTKFIIPNNAYNAAKNLMKASQYEEAISAFEKLDGFRNSKEQIASCNTAIQNREYDSAVMLMESGKYQEAITAFRMMDGYKDSKAQIEICKKEQQYEAAAALMANGEYSEAIDAFQAISEYLDSKQQIENCKIAIKEQQYNDAVALMDTKKYEKAISAFTSLDSYKDSDTLRISCEEAIKELKYQSALSWLNIRKYDMAYSTLAQIPGYKDVDELMNSNANLQEVARQAAYVVGNYVTFGAYELDGNTGNGKEPLEWLVLSRYGNKALLISKYAVGESQYNSVKGNITWDKCSLRTWLNSTFINNAFSGSERQKIQTTLIRIETEWRLGKYYTSSLKGRNTNDKVFLLSELEVLEYLPNESSRTCTFYDGKVASWWLRTPGDSFREPIYYYADAVSGRSGEFGEAFVEHKYWAIRPSIWVNIE